MTKISKIIEAGRSLEKNKAGFTVAELMTELHWGDAEKQYVQNIMFQMTKRGQAHKLNNNRPVIYTLKPHAGAAIAKPQAFASAGAKSTKLIPDKAVSETHSHAAARQDQDPPRESSLSLEDLAEMEIPLELIGEGVFRRNRELERRVHELESDLIDVKRRLDDANKRIGEQTRMIEKQNQIISQQNREHRTKMPAVKLKEATSIDWKRRS